MDVLTKENFHLVVLMKVIYLTLIGATTLIMSFIIALLASKR
jgi:hypothetical protein